MEGHIATYLNDHHAGSVAGVEIAKHLCRLAKVPDLHEKLAAVKSEIEADVRELEEVMDSLDVAKSSIRRAFAWMSEKATELKLKADDPENGPLAMFESLEVLSLGIEGKHGLWLALRSVAENVPGLQVADYVRLAKRAEDQREIIEQIRLAAAKEALSNN
ncbi:MAG: hypothetical protein JO053_02450 [Acidobacteria bacterium]|nr:hypothetical protein [Acidobacteriota bacterium]